MTYPSFHLFPKDKNRFFFFEIFFPWHHGLNGQPLFLNIFLFLVIFPIGVFFCACADLDPVQGVPDIQRFVVKANKGITDTIFFEKHSLFVPPKNTPPAAMSRFFLQV